MNKQHLFSIIIILLTIYSTINITHTTQQNNHEIYTLQTKETQHHTTYLVSPANSTITSDNNNTIKFIFNHTGYLEGTVNCTLFIDNIPVSSATDVPSDTDTGLYSNTTISDTTHNWWVECENSTHSESSTDIGANWTFTKDTISPRIRFEPPTEESGSLITTRDWAYVNLSIEDESKTSAFIDMDDTLIGWWRFNNESGENQSYIKDSSGHENNGNIIDANITGFGKFGKSARFNNAVYPTGKINIQYMDSMTTMGDRFTISAWIYETNITGYSDDIYKTNKYSFSVLTYNKASDADIGDLVFTYDNETTQYIYISSHPVDIELNRWNHVAISSNSTHIRLYINGTNVKTSQINGHILHPTIDFYIGNNFNGNIDNVMLWNCTLSDDEIYAQYDENAHHISINYTQLSDDIHTFKAYVQDSAGNINQTDKITTRYLYIPHLRYNAPTLEDSSFKNRDWAEISATIDEPHTEYIIVHWNDTELTLYDESLETLLNFNNNTLIGEDSTRAIDSFGNMNGTIDGATYTEGRFNKALSFDGTDDYAYIDDTGNTLTQEGTISLWIRTGEIVQDSSGIIVKSNSSSDTDAPWRFTWVEGTPDRIQFCIKNTTSYSCAQTSEIQKETWTHLTASWNQTHFALHKNGQIQEQNAYEPGTPENYGIRIGGFDDIFFNGTIDELRIYSRRLDNREIEYGYDSEIARYNETRYDLYMNITRQDLGTYSYYLWANDTYSNTGQTETRILTLREEPSAETIENTYWVRTDGNDTCTGRLNESYEENNIDCAWQTIQHAADSLAQWQTVRIQSGTYTQTSQIEISTPNTRYIGDNYPLITQTDNDTYGIYMEYTNSTTIYGLKLRNVSRGIHATYSHNLNISGNDIVSTSYCYDDPQRVGISVYKTSNTTIADNIINTTATGISVSGFDYGRRDVIIRNNTIDVPDHEGYCHEGGLALSVGGDSEGCGPDYNPWNASQICGWGGENIEISHNRIFASNRNAIALGANRYVYIHNNWLNNCDHNCIDLHGTKDTLAYENTIYNMSYGASSSFLIGPTFIGFNWSTGSTMSIPHNITIFNNHIENTKALGGILQACNAIDITLYNNTIINGGIDRNIGIGACYYLDFPGFSYGINMIGNRFVNCGAEITSETFYQTEPAIPGIINKTPTSFIIDNEINNTERMCIDLNFNKDVQIYAANNKYNCESIYSTSFARTGTGELYLGYYLDFNITDDTSTPIENAAIAMESVYGNYSPIIMENVFYENNFPTTNNSILAKNISSTTTDERGLTLDSQKEKDNIILWNLNYHLETNVSERIETPITWKIRISKEGFYPRYIYYAPGKDNNIDYPYDYGKSHHLMLNRMENNTLVLGENGINDFTASYTNLTRETATNHHSLSTTTENLSIHISFDNNPESYIIPDTTAEYNSIFFESEIPATSTTGRYGNGFIISNNTKNYLRFNNQDIFDPEENPVCYTIWLRPQENWSDTKPHYLFEKSMGYDIFLFGKGISTSASGLYDGSISNRIMNGTSGCSLSAFMFTDPWIKDEWNFVAECINRTNVTVWFNSEKDEYRTNFANATMDTDYPVWVGRNLNGTIDDLRVYNRWLTDEDISSIMNNTHEPTGTMTTVTYDSYDYSDTDFIWDTASIDAEIPDQTHIDILWNYSSDGILFNTEPVTYDAESGIDYIFDNEARYGSLIFTLRTDNSTLTPILKSVSIISVNISDIERPIVNLIAPEDNTITNEQTITFTCYAQDGQSLKNMTLWGDWTGTWQENETEDISGTKNSTVFTKTIPDGTHKWNCKAYDTDNNWSISTANRTITVDTITPKIFIHQPTPIFETIESNSIYFNITSDEALSDAKVEWNRTSNMTMSGSGTAWHLERTQIHNGNYTYRIYIEDIAGNINMTEEYWVNIDHTSYPQYSSMSINTTQKNATALFRLSWTDDAELDTSVFSTNNSGSWVNYTYPLSGISSMTSATIRLNDTLGIDIGYGFYANNSNGYSNSTGMMILTTTCTENWTYSSWSACTNSIQTRTSTDLNNCGTIENRSALSQSCTTTSSTSNGGGGSSGGAALPLPTTTANNTNQTEPASPITGHTIDINTTTDDNNNTATNQTQTDPDTPTDSPSKTQPIEENPSNTIKHIAITTIILLATGLIILKTRKNIPINPEDIVTEKNTPTTDLETQKQKLTEIEQYISQIRPIIVRMTIENQLNPEFEKRLDKIENEKNTASELLIKDYPQAVDNIARISEELAAIKNDIEVNTD